MLRGVYTSTRAMILDSRALDVTANDLANAQTTGFRPSRVSPKAFYGIGVAVRADLAGNSKTLGGSLSTGVTEDVVRSTQQGPILDTPGQPLNLALMGAGYFQVAAANGGTLLTRDGTFRRSLDGTLVTQDGSAVLSTGGIPIKLPAPAPGKEFIQSIRIDQSGIVYDGDGAVVARVGVVDVDPATLTEAGHNYYQTTSLSQVGPADPQTTVLQAKLEGSAVDLGTEMTLALLASEHFKLNQKVFQTADETIGYLADNLGRPGA